MAELSEQGCRITGLCQSPQALNNKRAKMSACSVPRSESERGDGREDGAIADGKTVKQTKNCRRVRGCQILSVSASSSLSSEAE